MLLRAPLSLPALCAQEEKRPPLSPWPGWPLFSLHKHLVRTYPSPRGHDRAWRTVGAQVLAKLSDVNHKTRTQDQGWGGRKDHWGRETYVCKGTKTLGWGGPGCPTAPPRLPAPLAPQQAGCQELGFKSPQVLASELIEREST